MNIAKFNCRVARLKDAEAISLLVQQVLRHSILPDCTKSGADTLLAATTSQGIKDKMNEQTVYFVAETFADDAVKIIGVIGIQADWHLYHFFISPRYQRQHIGRSLWKQLKTFVLQEWRAEFITVNSSINAVSFYRRLGFEPIGGYRIRRGIKDVPMKLLLSINE